ncbi:MAG TPA: hypothetical protein VK427_01030, partial [Kofleriaceae bacterium]|nr:hypothetical protein [Kofleriaceae bacterium]
QRLVFRGLEPRFIEAAAHRRGTLRELELDLQPPGAADAGWRYVLSRDVAPGAFTRLVVRPRGGSHAFNELASVLSQIPATLRELVITTPKKLVLRKRERADLVAALARFDGLERCELPWPELANETRPPAPVEVDTGRHFAIRVIGEPLFVPARIPAVWDVVERELGLRYDSFAVGAKWRQLGNDPVARIQKWAGNARCYDMKLFRDGTRGTLSLSRPEYAGQRHVSTMLLASFGSRRTEEIVAWWLRFLELATFETGTLDLDGVTRPRDVFSLGELDVPHLRAAWLLYFGPALLPLLPLADVAALAKRPGLEGMFVRATTRGVVVGLAPTPEEITDERLSACAAALHEILRPRVVARHGYVLAERALALLGPLATELGLSLIDNPSKLFSLRFASADTRRCIRLTLEAVYGPPLDTAPMLAAFFDDADGHTPVASDLARVEGRADVDAVLIRFADRVRDYVASQRAQVVKSAASGGDRLR